MLQRHCAVIEEYYLPEQHHQNREYLEWRMQCCSYAKHVLVISTIKLTFVLCKPDSNSLQAQVNVRENSRCLLHAIINKTDCIVMREFCLTSAFSLDASPRGLQARHHEEDASARMWITYLGMEVLCRLIGRRPSYMVRHQERCWRLHVVCDALCISWTILIWKVSWYRWHSWWCSSCWDRDGNLVGICVVSRGIVGPAHWYIVGLKVLQALPEVIIDVLWFLQSGLCTSWYSRPGRASWVSLTPSSRSLSLRLVCHVCIVRWKRLLKVQQPFMFYVSLATTPWSGS